jgi:cellulose synthase/poly-beta-1,6-N-acetylglucosamine synthase-like glycosyltransferase
MASPLRYLLAPVLVAFVVGLAALTLFGDLLAASPPLSMALLAFDARVLLGLAVAIFAVSFLLYLYSLSREDPDALVHSGRAVEALVPVYGEEQVMHRSVEHLAASTYEDLTVTVVCEPDDEPCIERAADLAAAHDRVRYVVNDRPGSKAGALNDGIERSDADVIAMFDADQEPHPELIAHGMAALEDSDVARVRTLPRPSEGLLESMAYYEYLLLFFLPQKLVRYLLGLGFAGTRSVLVEREVFEQVGLFSEDHLTEDMDFTHRCHQAGLSIRELSYYPCFEESAHTLRDWWGQRVRWMTGHVAVGHSHVRDWRKLVDPDFLGSLVTLVGTFAAGVVLSVTLPKLVLVAVGSPGVVAAGLGGIYAIALLTRAVDSTTVDMGGFDLGWLLIPVALTLFGLVIVQVILSYALGREGGWYQVEKHA